MDDAAPTPLAGADALADLARRSRFFDALAASLADGRFRRLVLAKPRPGAGELQRVSVRRIDLRGQPCLQLVSQQRTRDLTENLPLDEAQARIEGLLGPQLAHAHLFCADEELQLLISRKGRIALHRSRVAQAEAEAADGAATGHARQKRRLLALDAPFLQALGVVDRGGALVPAMARKWKQINKFVEVLAHALDEAGLAQGEPPPGAAPLQVVDFGAGKGYLTFATHHHLTDRATGRGWPARTLGVELRQELVDLCNDAAHRCAMAGLQFECGDVSRVLPPHVDVMIALHACDTATDHALNAGIRAGAAVILSSPCCHKQLRPQLELPAVLRPMLRHGIHLGQEAEMLTDSLRALLLESRGYEAQVFEFVSLEHTSKNKMILAVKRRQPLPAARQAALKAQVAEIKAFYGIREHALETLLEAETASAQASAGPLPSGLSTLSEGGAGTPAPGAPAH